MFKTVDKIIFAVVALSIVLIVGYMVMHKRNVKTSSRITGVKYSYDTDLKNDEYIKGNLTSQQLAIFDKILEQEKANGGLKLSNVELAINSNHDHDLSAAYLRWRNCKEMMRSDYRTFYPSERKHFGN